MIEKADEKEAQRGASSLIVNLRYPSGRVRASLNRNAQRRYEHDF
jgi:hypothetical protein